MRRGHKAQKVLLIIVLGIGLLFLFSFIVKTLWNAILPEVTSAGPLNLWQAMGLLVLAKIFFSGFRGKHGPPWRHRMREKWAAMTPEEREKFKQEWKARCSWKHTVRNDPPPPANAESKSE